LEGTKTKKKKKKSKKKKRKSEHGSSEDESKLKLKKTKKKRSGFEISEKTLKKLLKKNIIRKEALEKMISDEGSRKKRKKKHSDEEKVKGKTMQSSSDDEIKKVVKVSRSRCRDRREVDERRSIRRKEASEEREDLRGGNRRDSSEEYREVKASREGKIQVRLPNRESSSMVPAKKSLASTVQANLLKMASQDSSGRGERGRRNSPQRKSVKDRLGPLRREGNSPGRSSLRENDRSRSRLEVHSNRAEGRKQFARDADYNKNGEDSWGLEPVPANLQAWAGRHSPVKQDRDTRRSKQEDEEYGRKKASSVGKRDSSEKKGKSLNQRRKRGM